VQEDWEIEWADYYKILQVDSSAEPEVIEAAYRRLTRKYHPDVDRGPTANERMKKINIAYRNLSDPDKRKRYHSEWLQKVGKAAGTSVGEPPKPVVDPQYIKFHDVEPSQIQTSSFVIRNLGGPYSKIWFSNPDSWVRVIGWESLSTSDELPLEVKIEAEGEEWGKSYIEYIKVKLDEEETQVRIELTTKPEPVRKKAAVSGVPKARPTTLPRGGPRRGTPAGTTIKHKGFPAWGKWFLGLAILGLIVTLTVQLWPSGSPSGTTTTMPDGTRIAFSSIRSGKWEIYVISADGSNQTNLTRIHAVGTDPAWSPDGTKIAFVSNRDGNYKIYVMDADGSNQTRLTDNSPDYFTPAWSPDGTRIAFVSNRDYNYEIYVMDADGGNQTRLTKNVAYDCSPAWSPDGTRIAFVSPRNGNYEIYVMDADGSNLINLTNNPANDYSPSWSPDGTRIAFSSWRDGRWGIHVMNVDGSNQTRLTNALLEESDPAWSPDGTRIAFSSIRSGKWEIYVISADGSNQTNLTTNSVESRHPAWAPR